MNRFALAGAGLAAIALVLGGLAGLRPDTTSAGQAVTPGAAPQVAAAHASLASGGSVHPLVMASVAPGSVTLPSRAKIEAQNAPQAMSVATRFLVTQDLKAFADELLVREERLSREERYFLAKALETCGFAVSMNDDLVAASQRRRREFLDTLSPTDPEYSRRVAAYDAADDMARCRGFQGQRIAQKKIDDLYRASGDAGDPRAQARLLVADLAKNLGGSKNSPTVARAVVQDDVSRIIGLLESRDGEAIVTVAQFLADHRLIEQMRIGPNGEAANPASLVGALLLVACDFQPVCSAFDREALQACAHAGYCNASSFDELYANFLASPFAWSLASQYRTLIHTAIETRNWSLIGLQKLVGARAKARP